MFEVPQIFLWRPLKPSSNFLKKAFFNDFLFWYNFLKCTGRESLILISVFCKKLDEQSNAIRNVGQTFTRIQSPNIIF